MASIVRIVDKKKPGQVEKERGRKCRQNGVWTIASRRSLGSTLRAAAQKMAQSRSNNFLKLVEIDPRNFGISEFKVHGFAQFHPVAQMRAHSDGRSRLSNKQDRLTVVPG